MASQPEADGSTSTGETLSPAQQLMAKHAEESHKPTIEEVVDEEDIAHPPPSSTVQHSETEPSSQPIEAPMSEKAAGKQKVQDTPEAETTSKGKDNAPPNIQSEEAFPALGAPKSQGPSSAAAAWGKKPSSVVSNGAQNGKPTPGSGTSTPASGVLTPGSTNAPPPGSQRAAGPQTMSLPGRYKEQIQLAPSQLTPRHLLKKPVQDVLRDINRGSKANVEMRHAGVGNDLVFEGTGPVDAVRQALKEVANQLGSKQSVTITIPASLRAHIIGRQGATIQGIQKRTGARINMRQEEGSTAMDDDDSATVDVVIEGDAVAAEMARREVEAIVNEKTSNVNMRLRHIPPELYPFLAAAQNSRLNALQEGKDVNVEIPQYQTWSGQAPTPTAKGQQVAFTPQNNLPILVSGDRQAAQDARAELDRQVQELQRQLTSNQMLIERGRHQFIVGDRGRSLHDFLEETGCTVILPPPGDDSETLTIVGPADRIENGINKVMELADSVRLTSVDVARQHANVPNGGQAHARNINRYLRQRQMIDELERMHDASIALPTSTDGPTNWEICSQDFKNATKARADIMDIISGHPPARLSSMNVDPFYHQHLQQRLAQQVRDNYGVHIVLPEESDESPEILLVYEGPTVASEYQLPRGQPSPAQLREFERALQEAQAHILGITSGQEDLVSRELEAPPKFHDKIRRYVDREQQGLPENEIPIQLLFDGAGPQAARRAPANGFSMRGPSQSVGDLTEKILAFIKQEEQDERERGYTTSFDFPQKFANVLIGRKGENIRKLRDEYDVDIQVNEGKVELKGPKAKADAAKAHILALARKLEDETTHVLKIKPQFHGELIGPKGSQVNRLQDRYNVRINFPRSATAGNEDGVDASGEEPQRQHRAQAPDEVHIRGPKRGADEARDELLNLLQWTLDNSHTATVSVAPSQLPLLIGSGGREMENLRLTTGASIDVPGQREVDPSGRAEIRIKGSKRSVEEAKKLLEERAKIFDETVTRTIDIDKKHHKALIGSGGANIRNIVMESGGPDDRRELARMVRFPRPDSDDNTIRVEGNKAVVDKIIASLQALANQRESSTTEILEVAPEKHRLLIGRGGEIRRNLESQFSIGVDIPKQTTTGPARSQVKLTGQPSDVEKAKAHILEIVKDQEGEAVIIPRSLHHAISDNGQFFRRLRNDHHVTVDHNGQKPPPRPAAPNPRGRANGGALPLITDDAPAAGDNFSWEIVDAHTSSEDGDIPWILRGSPENVARAKAQLERALANAQKPSATGYLILPDPRTYRFVIGPGGSQINDIRKKTGTRVNVPRDQTRGEAIEIIGGRDGVEQAKDIILELVKNGGRRGE